MNFLSLVCAEAGMSPDEYDAYMACIHGDYHPAALVQQWAQSEPEGV